MSIEDRFVEDEAMWEREGTTLVGYFDAWLDVESKCSLIDGWVVLPP